MKFSLSTHRFQNSVPITPDADLGGVQEADLEGVQVAFAAACSSRLPPRTVCLRLGGLRVRLRVAGETLGTLLTRAFAPLIDISNADCDEAAVADLHIGVWDRAETGVGCPGLALVPDRTEVLGPGLLFQYRGGRLLRYERSTIVKCLDRTHRKLFMCVQSAAQLGLNDRTRPFEHFLRAWAHDRARHVLHAGLVSRNGRGVLLGGQGGAGKSTTAIACALGGLDFLGDDFVASAMTHGTWCGHALYDTVRVDSSGLDRFPALRARSMPPLHARDGSKYLVYMSDALEGMPARRVTSTRLAAIVIPTIGGTGPTFLRPASRGETLRRLAPSTLLRALGGGRQSFSHMAGMVRQLPCYELILGRSLEPVPALVQGLLDGTVP